MSALNQTYFDFELIIVDDNSKDNTWQIIDSYTDGRIKRYRNEVNIGEYANRNKAISLARGEYLIFIDADDVVYSNGLEFMMQFVANYSDCAMIIARPWHEKIIYPKRITPHQFYSFEYLGRGICGINFTKVLFKTSALQKDIPFTFNVKLGDYYIQLKLARNYNSVIIPDAATWWRRNNGQASEKLLKDAALYTMHCLWIQLEMLKHEKCPFTQIEIEAALTNLYSGFLRILIKQMMRLRISVAWKLIMQYPVPVKYWFSILKKVKRNYPENYSGSNPMHD